MNLFDMFENHNVDMVGFSLDSERAYQAVMSRFGDFITQDEDSGIMYVPEKLWGRVQQVAFDADGIGAIDQHDDWENPEHYGVSEESLNEFAPSDSGDNDEEDVLHKYARMWYNGDLKTQQQVEQILDRMGWEIGELESEEGGCFVVQSGDENGDTYIGFAPEDLTEGVAEGSLTEFAPNDDGGEDRDHEYEVYQCNPDDQFDWIGGPIYKTDDMGKAHDIAYNLHKKYPNNAFMIWQERSQGSRGGYGIKDDEQGIAEAGFTKTPSGDYINQHTGVRSSKPPVKKKRGEKTGAEWDAIEKAKKDKEQGVAEGTGNIGNAIKSLYQKIYNAGDDEVEYFYNDSPIFAQYWDEYEGDLDSIIAEVDPGELQVILDELESYAQQAGLAEAVGGKVEAYGYAYNKQDQRVMWRKIFPSAEAAYEWAESKNATVLGTREVQQDVNEARKANTKTSRAEFGKRTKKPTLSDKEQEQKNKDSDEAWARLMAHVEAEKKKQQGVDEELTMKHQRDHKTQKYADTSNSLAKRSFQNAEVPNVPKTADGHPTVKYRFGGQAGQTRVEPTITPTTVKRKDADRPIPSFLKKGVAEGIETGITKVNQDTHALDYIVKEAIGPIELAQVLYDGLEEKYPEVVSRFGHEVVGDAVMDAAEEAQDVHSMSDVDIIIDEIMSKLSGEDVFGDNGTDELDEGDEEPFGFVDPELEKTLNYAKRHYPGKSNKEQAFMKLAQRGLKHSAENDIEHDVELKQLRRDVDKIKGAMGIAESRLYFNVIGTTAGELRSDFGMRKDAKGWFLSSNSGAKRIMEAQRAFGKPRLL